jgi:HPt (histidine-containing phosphotransfer) domain-containing protein
MQTEREMELDLDMAEARLVLADRIEDLANALGTRTVTAVAREVHSIKGLAASFDLAVVAGLAHALESDMARLGAETPILGYLDRMVDALDSDVRNDPVWLHQLISKAQRTASVA